MCKGTAGCRKPENMKQTGGNCSPEQIRICHGNSTEHPCEKKEEEQS